MVDPEFAWLDGQLVPWGDATVHVSSLGFGFGLSVFEGIRAYWDDRGSSLLVFRLADHVRRLYQSAKIYRLEVPYSRGELEAAVLKVLEANSFEEDIYLRIYAYPGSPWGAERSENVCVFGVPRPSNLGTAHPNGLRCNTSSWRRIPDDVIPPRAKMAGNYLQYALAENESHAGGYQEPIMLTTDGKVSEPPGANIFLVHGDELITSTVTSSVLEGITRSTIMTLARDNLGSLIVRQRPIDRTELYLADEIFICGTGHAEVTPVSSVDGIAVGNASVGPVTTELRTLYSDLVHGRQKRYSDWVTSVPAPVS